MIILISAKSVKSAVRTAFYERKNSFTNRVGDLACAVQCGQTTQKHLKPQVMEFRSCIPNARHNAILCGTKWIKIASSQSLHQKGSSGNSLPSGHHGEVVGGSDFVEQSKRHCARSWEKHF